MPLRLLLTTSLLMSMVVSSFAQIGFTKAEVIEQYGPKYEVGETDDGSEYFHHTMVDYTEDGEAYVKELVTYFMKDNEGGAFCYRWLLFEHISKAKSLIRMLDQDMERIKPNEWKHKESNSSYILIMEDEQCILRCKFDYKEG